MAAGEGGVVVFGGWNYPLSPTFGDTWVLNGNVWSAVTGNGPPSRFAAGLVYDEFRDQFVLFGGNGTDPGAPVSYGDTWLLSRYAVLLAHPQQVTTCPASVPTFSVTAAGSGPFTYQWRKGGNPIDTIANPSAATTTLTLPNVGLDDVDSYDCVVTNACGSVTSNAATLLICPGDYNCDNGIDGDDVIGFFTDWDSGLIAADFNGDGGVDGDDVIDFFQRWDSGC
jgi:hypothetical protein